MFFSREVESMDEHSQQRSASTGSNDHSHRRRHTKFKLVGTVEDDNAHFLNRHVVFSAVYGAVFGKTRCCPSKSHPRRLESTKRNVSQSSCTYLQVGHKVGRCSEPIQVLCCQTRDVLHLRRGYQHRARFSHAIAYTGSKCGYRGRAAAAYDAKRVRGAWMTASHGIPSIVQYLIGFL